MNTLMGLIITLVFLGLIFYAVWWFLGMIALPEPFDKLVRVLVALMALIYVLGVLTGNLPTFRVWGP